MSYWNHIAFTLFTATLCITPLHAQTPHPATLPNPDDIAFYYFPHGNDNTDHDFDISFSVNGSEIQDAYFATVSELKVVVEYQELTQFKQTSFTPIMSPKSFKNVGDYFFGEVKLGGLRANTAYRARLSFLNPQANGTFTKVGMTPKTSLEHNAS